MKEKEIIIADPMACTDVNTSRQGSLEFVVEQMHGALFDCIEEFYPQWRCDRTAWSKKYPQLTATNFSSTKTGLCVSHLIRHLKNGCLDKPLNKENVAKEAMFLLIQLLHMEGNTSTLQLEALDMISSYVQRTNSEASTSQ